MEKELHYGVATMALDAYTSDKIASTFSLYDASSIGFETAGREFVENFQDKDIMAVWIIDRNGNIILSSSGFQIEENVDMPDYAEALNSENGVARWTGKLPSGEKIMASTCIYKYSTGIHGGAVRFMISLEAIDSQLVRISFIVAFCCIFMFALLILSGSLFIRSIVNPVRDIETINFELILSDMEILERKIDNVKKAMKGDKTLAKELLRCLVPESWCRVLCL